MKKILYLFGFILILSSCESLVEEEVFSTITPNNFFQNERDIEIAVNGVYDGIQQTRGQGEADNVTDLNAYMAGEFDMQWNPAFVTLNINNTEPQLWNMWRIGYRNIGRANAVLAALENSTVADEVKNRYAGEVRFIRAYVYFNLVRIFGHIPLAKTAPRTLNEVILPDTTLSNAFEGEYLKQVELEEIYNFIIEDLKFSEEFLPVTYNANNAGRVTKGAASGMLARVYITQAGYRYDYNNGGLILGDASKYEMAAQKCQEIISSGTYTLLPEYYDIFSIDNNAECLFSIQYVSHAQSGQFGEGFTAAPEYGIRGADATPRAYNWNTINMLYYDDWVAANGMSDKRYATTFITQFVQNNGSILQMGTGNFRGPTTAKLISDYTLPIKAQNLYDYGDNWIVQRYADILLMHSEALNESGGTPDQNTIIGVNMVRARAGKTELTLPISKEDLREEIWNERKWELCFEGFYSYFDCQRTGRYLTEIAKYANNRRQVVPTVKYNIMPIPFNATEANKSLKQNFGW